MKHYGSCQCGNVTLEATFDTTSFHACHCSMCRKLTGGPMMAVNAGQNVSFKGEQYIHIYDSSEWMERGSCKQCSTALFSRLKESQEYFLSLWLLNNAEDFSLDAQLFIDNKPENYNFANETQCLTEAQIFAAFNNEK